MTIEELTVFEDGKKLIFTVGKNCLEIHRKEVNKFKVICKKRTMKFNPKNYFIIGSDGP